MPRMDDGKLAFAELSVADLTESLASASPAPGGGSAAAVAASLGASLVAMVARLSQGRPSYEAHGDLHARAVVAADQARLRFLELADDDATAYAAYRAARQLPHVTQSETTAREAASRRAAREATDVPL